MWVVLGITNIATGRILADHERRLDAAYTTSSILIASQSTVIMLAAGESSVQMHFVKCFQHNCCNFMRLFTVTNPIFLVA